MICGFSTDGSFISACACGKEKERERERQRQTDRQTDRQTGRDRQTETDRQGKLQILILNVYF